jgi:hypothetical protein
MFGGKSISAVIEIADENILSLRKPVISYGDHIKIGLIKTCDHLPRSVFS